MEFLKKHYEKLILLFLLLAFTFTLIYVLGIVKSTRVITDDSLQIATFAPDYTQLDPQDEKLNVDKVLANSIPAWHNAVARKEAHAEYFSDLVSVFDISRCPHCQKLIPRYFFFDRECPLCKKGLITPPEKFVEVLAITAEDSDGDGIPDAEELKYGLDPKNPADGRIDLAGDGFSNRYKFKNKYNLLDPRSRPPLWFRLNLVEIRKNKLDKRLNAVNTYKSDDKAKWSFQILDVKTGKSDNIYIGDSITINRRRYTLESVKLDQQEDSTAAENGKIRDESIAYIKSEDGQEVIEMKVNQDAYSKYPLIVFKDEGTPDKNIEVIAGEDFSMGNRKIGIEKYRVKSVDEENQTALLEDPAVFDEKKDATLDKNGTKMVVTKDGMIPKEDKVRTDLVLGNNPGSDTNPEVPRQPAVRRTQSQPQRTTAPATTRPGQQPTNRNR